MAEINISQEEETLSFQMQEVVIINKFQKEDSELYIKEVDFITDDELYRGEAVPGTGLGDPNWRIRHIVIAPDGDVSVRYAGGTTNFDAVWADRAGLVYS